VSEYEIALSKALAAHDAVMAERTPERLIARAAARDEVEAVGDRLYGHD